MAKCWMISYVGFSACLRCKLKISQINNISVGFSLASEADHDCFYWQASGYLNKRHNQEYNNIEEDFPYASWFKNLTSLFKTVSRRELETFLNREYYNGKVLDD